MKRTVDVGRKLTKANRILVELAAANGVEIKKIPGPKRRFRMNYGEKSYLVRAGFVTNAYNHRLALRLCRQKDVANSYLRARGFPAPENATFQKGEAIRAWNWAEAILPVVLKPVDGSTGKMVYVKISDREEFIELFDRIADQYDRVLVEQFKEGEDHRILVVNGKIVGVLKRVPASVVGDGKLSIRELVVAKNKERKDSSVLKQIKLDEEAKRNLVKLNYDFDTIPKKGEQVFLRSNANISDGADSYEVSHLLTEEMKKLVLRAIKSIPGLKVVGVDALIHQDELTIIELNGNPMINIHYDTTCGNGKNVGKDILEAMFPGLEITKELF